MTEPVHEAELLADVFACTLFRIRVYVPCTSINCGSCCSLRERCIEALVRAMPGLQTPVLFSTSVARRVLNFHKHLLTSHLECEWGCVS